MDFLSFAASHGLVIKSLVAGAWKHVPTTDKPKRRNGAYCYKETIGWVQNWAKMDSIATWRPDGQIAPGLIRANAMEDRRRILQMQAQAADKARELVQAATLSKHPYLERKGFPDALGLVVDSMLIVPMYVGRDLVGAQRIWPDGEKKFLPGQRSKGATYTIGRGAPVWCEGYATGMSVHRALTLARLPRSVVVCFSANNMQALASAGSVVADNDASGAGQRAAEATGLPYWMSDAVGEDFNDAEFRLGRFASSQSLKAALMRSQA